MTTRFCEECGAELSESAKFCASCGALARQPSPATADGVAATWSSGSAQPAATPPAAPAAIPPASAPGAPSVPKKRSYKGCAIGCGIVVLLLACVTLAIVGWLFQWPEQLGLVESPGRALFEPSPDPYAALALLTELEEAGISVEGLSIYVVPTKQGDLIAYVLAEEADGFMWSGPKYDNAIEGLLIHTAVTDAAHGLEINRVAVDYRGSEGEQIAVMTAPVAMLSAYHYDAISQELLFEEMNGRAGAQPLITLGGE